MASRSLTLPARPALTLLRAGAPTGAPAASAGPSSPSVPFVPRAVVPCGVYEEDCAAAGWREFYAISSTGAKVLRYAVAMAIDADASAVLAFLASQLLGMEYGGPRPTSTGRR